MEPTLYSEGANIAPDIMSGVEYIGNLSKTLDLVNFFLTVLIVNPFAFLLGAKLAKLKKITYLKSLLVTFVALMGSAAIGIALVMNEVTGYVAIIALISFVVLVNLIMEQVLTTKTLV